MHITLFCAAILAAFPVVANPNQTPAPIWELSEETLQSATRVGSVTLVDGTIGLDGTNALILPAELLGDQSGYTIEFEVKRPEGTTHGHNLRLVSNGGETNPSGFGLTYSPPVYNAGLLSVNGFLTAEQRNFLDGNFVKVTLVARDGKLSLFKNGLLLAVTDTVKPGTAPLQFGGIEEKPPLTYLLRNIRVYDSEIFPSGFDPSAERMRNHSGDGYFMQRADVRDTTLPRILVVGDSISMAYRGFIAEHFRERAYVDYWVGGGWFGETARGEDSPAKRSWNGVLSHGPYDVVSWNSMTLHMWNGAPGRLDEATYPANMTEMVGHLRAVAPNTHFIWNRCTPWRTTPEKGRAGLDPVRNGVILRLNAATDAIMEAHGIPVVDLYTLAESRMDTVPEGSTDAVHWNREVSEEMSALIIAEIEKALSSRKTREDSDEGL